MQLQASLAGRLRLSGTASRCRGTPRRPFAVPCMNLGMASRLRGGRSGTGRSGTPGIGGAPPGGDAASPLLPVVLCLTPRGIPVRVCAGGTCAYAIYRRGDGSTSLQLDAARVTLPTMERQPGRGRAAPYGRNSVTRALGFGGWNSRTRAVCGEAHHGEPLACSRRAHPGVGRPQPTVPRGGDLEGLRLDPFRADR